MTKRLSSKRKIYLQLGTNIWGKAPYIWKGAKKDKWKNTPGEHKKKHRTLERMSPLVRGEYIYNMLGTGHTISKPNNKVKIAYYEPKYVSQLREKQKLRSFYGNVREKHLINYYLKAHVYKGKIGDNLIKQLEKRLDTVIFRANFVNSIYQARQLINHGHVFVNGSVQTIPGLVIQQGDMIQINPKVQYTSTLSHHWALVKKAAATVYKYVPHLEVDYKTLACIFLYTPTIEEIQYTYPLDINKAIRHYI